MAPEETCERAMRIRLLVGELMMSTVNRNPACRRFMEAGHCDNRHGMFQRFGAFQATMSQQPVIAKVDTKEPANMGAN